VTDAPKPCPFCGGEAKLGYDSGNEVWGQTWWVHCPACGISTGRANGSSTWLTDKAVDRAAKASVVSVWNRRVR
jgi:hypothetical protein